MKVKVEFKMKHGQCVIVHLPTPLERAVTLPVSGIDFKFKYFACLFYGVKIIKAIYVEQDAD